MPARRSALSKIPNGFSKFPHALLRVVRRPIVHNQNLPLFRGKILRQNAGDSFLNVLPVVVGIDQDGEERRLHSFIPTGR